MNKKVGIILSFGLCFSVGVTFSSCELSDFLENVTPVDKAMVTQEEWTAAFDYSDENYVEISKVSTTDSEIQRTFKGAVDKFEITGVFTLMGNQDESKSWYSIENGKLYSYEKVNDNEYSKSEDSSSSMKEITIVHSIQEMAPEIFDYGRYTYDENEKAYKADIILSDGEEIARACQFKFEEGKLVFGTVKYTRIKDFLITVEFSLTYGNAAVTLPTNLKEE